MASLTRWAWVWVNSGSWWWTGRPGVLRFMGSQRVRHDWASELNWGSEGQVFWARLGCFYVWSGRWLCFWGSAGCWLQWLGAWPRFLALSVRPAWLIHMRFPGRTECAHPLEVQFWYCCNVPPLHSIMRSCSNSSGEETDTTCVGRCYRWHIPYGMWT